MHLRYFLIVLCIDTVRSDGLIRNTVYGQIKGNILTSLVSNRKFYVFNGVPYASPPLGKLRFQNPVPPKPWNVVRDALEEPDVCIQLLEFGVGPGFKGNEDCLYLKIAYPINNNRMLPVLVWIHGGTFLFGSTFTTAPDYFMEEDVVLVQIQYRLNVFGFFSTEDEYASGNWGLKDQALALTWVKNNIQFFNGDPDKVTIFGCSAGGASVQLHMLSPRSRGLFDRAISQSGTPLNRWGFQRRPLASVKKLAAGLGVEASNTTALIEKLQVLPAEVILNAAFNQTIMGYFLPYTEQPFSPSIEKESDSAFLTEPAFKLLEEGKFADVPYMMGHNTEEGSFPYNYIDINKVNINIYNKHPELIIPKSMNIAKNSHCVNIVLNKIRQFYFDNATLTHKSNWINYMANDLFIRGIFKSVDYICKQQNLYYYIFNATGHKWLSSEVGGAPHYSEVLYLLQPQNSQTWPSDETAEEKVVRRRLVRLWVNFAIFGNPTPHSEHLLQNVMWPKFCSHRSYLEINNSGLVVKTDPNEKDLRFWKYLFDKCGFPPYYTY